MSKSNKLLYQVYVFYDTPFKVNNEAQGPWVSAWAFAGSYGFIYA